MSNLKRVKTLLNFSIVWYKMTILIWKLWFRATKTSPLTKLCLHLQLGLTLSAISKRPPILPPLNFGDLTGIVPFRISLTLNQSNIKSFDFLYNILHSFQIQIEFRLHALKYLVLLCQTLCSNCCNIHKRIFSILQT